MIADQQTIELAVQRLVEVAKPTRVILFGSYARGDATEDSDLDFLVIEEDISSKINEMVRLRTAIGQIGISVDVVVCTEEELSDWGHLPGTTIYWALEEGRILYEKAA